MRILATALALSLPFVVGPALEAALPIFDARVPYSHDACDNLPPTDAIAIAILRKAGVQRALVSSSGDDGTQRLVAEAAERIAYRNTDALFAGWNPAPGQ